MTKSSQMKIKRKSTPKNKQTQSITPRIPLNTKLENKTLKDKKQEFKNTLKTRHSISSKEDLKKKASQTFVKQFYQTSSNLLGTSNGALPTNYTDKEDDKKNRQTVICDNKINFKEEMHLKYLGNLFRTSNLKKTIIIDDDGNNNLNINKDLFIQKKKEKNKKVDNLNNKNNIINNNKIKKKNLKKSKSTHKQIISDNILIQNLESKKNIPKKLKKDEDERLLEYDFIFDLLNTNIEEMKDMFKKSPIKQKESSDNIFKKTPKKKIIQIFSEKEKEEINNIKPLLSQIEISINNNNNNIKNNENNNNIIKNNENNSFLESCIQDEFYQSFINKQQSNSYHSFDMSSVINNSNLNNNNSDRTECEEDIIKIDENALKRTEINPHFLVGKKNKKKCLENVGNNQNCKSTKNLSSSNDKCSIF